MGCGSFARARLRGYYGRGTEIPKLKVTEAVVCPIMRCVIAKARRFQLGPWGSLDQGCTWRISMGCHICSNTHGTLAVNIVFSLDKRREERNDQL